MAGFVRKQHPKEDRPVTAPVLSDLVPDVKHAGGHLLSNLCDGSVYAGLMRGGEVHRQSQDTAAMQLSRGVFAWCCVAMARSHPN